MSNKTRTFLRDTRTREAQADKPFREIIEIADDASGDYVTTGDGKGSSITRTSNARGCVSMPASGRQPDSRRGNTAIV